MYRYTISDSAPSTILMTIVQLFAVQPENKITGMLFSSALFPFNVIHQNPDFSLRLFIKNAPLSLLIISFICDGVKYFLD